MAVQRRIAEARRVRGLLPQTWSAWAAGMVDQVRIRLIAGAVDKLAGNHSIIEGDYRVVGYAAGHTFQRHSTLRQCRADLFADIVLGRVDLAGSPTGRTHDGAVIGVMVPLTTLAGFDDMPGECFDQRFVLPADVVRELATEPATLFYRLLTDPLGHIPDMTELGRFPSTKLHIALNMRDGTCAFPACNVPAINGSCPPAKLFARRAQTPQWFDASTTKRHPTSTSPPSPSINATPPSY